MKPKKKRVLPYPDLPEHHIWNIRTFKEYMQDVRDRAETPEELDQIEENLCMGLMTMNCSGLHGFGRPTMK